jgi:hypothetical protein
MNPLRTPNRRFAACLLLLAGVLVLGIVQWSFLPILIQNGPSTSATVQDLSGSHSSKFAAPFKYLFGDGLRLCVVPSAFTLQRVTAAFVPMPDASFSRRDDFSLAQPSLRAPPSAS